MIRSSFWDHLGPHFRSSGDLGGFLGELGGTLGEPWGNLGGTLGGSWKAFSVSDVNLDVLTGARAQDGLQEAFRIDLGTEII